MADEDLDAEGEMVAEHEHEPEVAERQHAPLIAQAEIAQQSPVSLSVFVHMSLS